MFLPIECKTPPPALLLITTSSSLVRWRGFIIIILASIGVQSVRVFLGRLNRSRYTTSRSLQRKEGWNGCE